MIARLGRYELMRPLGKGGMAEVFLARYRGPGGFEKRLVIKRILPHLAANPRFLRMFFEEARLHVSLTHGNLVAIFDFGRVGNSYFLAMEYVDGHDLAALLEAGRKAGVRMSSGCVALIGQELCRALTHVHRHGLVHRDVTPRNVLVSGDGEVKLTDFGVVQRGAAHELGVRGTVAYMAPEQARGEPVDHRADLYALGLILAEAVRGAPVRDTRKDVDADLTAAGASPVVEVEGPFAALIARATAPDPDDRYPDAASMAAALEQIERSLGGSRAEAVRLLADQVRGLKLPADEAAASLAGEDGPATYYRGANTEVSIVDAIVAPPAESHPWRWRLGGLLVIAGLGAATALLTAPASVKPPIKDPGPARVQTSPSGIPDLGVAGPVSREQPASIRAVRVNVHPGSPTPKRVATPPAQAVVRLQCIPWCTVDLDGRREGEGGLAHVLRVAPGHHQLVLRRLEDVQQRAVDLAPGAEEAISVRFD